jgi:hypothetical protein
MRHQATMWNMLLAAERHAVYCMLLPWCNLGFRLTTLEIFKISILTILNIFIYVKKIFSQGSGQFKYHLCEHNWTVLKQTWNWVLDNKNYPRHLQLLLLN